MNFYTRSRAKIVVFLLLNLSIIVAAHAQANLMLMNSSVPAQWAPAALGVTPGNTSVTIMSGDTISLDILGNCSKLTIQKGAVLNSATSASSGNLNSLEAGGATAPNPDTIQNDGLFGSTGGLHDGIALAIPTTCSNMVLTGAGITAIGSITPVNINTSLTFELAQNASVNNKGVAFSAVPVADSNAVADKVTFTIDTGKTLTIANTGGKLQGPSIEGIGGNYTYNIKGTLDLSATTDTSSITPFYASAGSVVTTNVSGKLKLGGGFVGAGNTSGGAGGGKTVFNILAGGLVDATNTSYLNMGTNFFVTYSGGFFKRKVDNLGEIFPIGAPGSAAFNPVYLNNKGTVTNFSVSVQYNPDNGLLPDPTRTVTKYWTIKPDAPGSNATVELAWLPGDQSSNFNPTQSVSIANYNGTSLAETAAKVTGLGTPASPYVAAATGFTSFGYFVVLNSKVNTQGAGLMKVYPNPVNDVVNITFPAVGGNSSISINTTDGAKKLSSNISSGSNSWNTNVSSYPPGVYVITLNNGGTLSSQKFIKL